MRLYLVLKRLFDLASALVGLVLLVPVLTTIAILIKIGSPGPVFYYGVRVGRFSRPFRIVKFRTMVMDAEKVGGSSTPEDDPRITSIGRFLRKFKLDEIPQLINVLLGTMSIVGPRPQVPWAVKLYSPNERKILNVRPGITDFASLRFRNEGEILRGASNPDEYYLNVIHPEKMRLALEYVDKCSFSVDLAIIFRTIVAVVGRSRRKS